MTNVNGWISFKEIVDSVQLSEGDSADQGQFMRKLNFAIKAYTSLRLTSLPAVKSVTLPIEGEMRVVSIHSPLINDFLKFVSVGVWYEDEFHEYRPKSNLVVKSDADCGVDTRDVPEYTDPTYYTGYYSLDLENRRIVIDAPSNITEVVLNYTPTGVKSDGLTWIPRMCADVIEKYVEWEVARRDKNVSGNDKMIYKAEYVAALNVFRGLQYNTTELFNEYYLHLATGKQY